MMIATRLDPEHDVPITNDRLRVSAFVALVDGQATLRGMHLPYFMRRVNRVFTNPVLGTVAWIVPGMGVIHHTGRETGRKYRSPVMAFRSKRGFVIPMTYGRDVDWGRNIMKAGRCDLMCIGKRYTLRNPRIVDGNAAYAHLPIGIRSALRAANLPGFVLLDLGSTPGKKRK
jgi:deazaflavin-dependent oxidoreductase (nitroreductase family)